MMALSYEPCGINGLSPRAAGVLGLDLYLYLVVLSLLIHKGILGTYQYVVTARCQGWKSDRVTGSFLIKHLYPRLLRAVVV